jgi:transposase
MHGVRERVLLRHLLEQDISISEAARQLDVHRATLHRWIDAGLLDTDTDEIRARYSPRPAVASKLDPYKAVLTERLREFPALTAVRLLAEIRAAGYTGSYSQLRDYVRALRPAAVPEPVIRFETPPAHQAQVDFAHCKLPWGVRYALVVVLSYSRWLWVQFFPRQDLRTLILGLEQCFAAWGGVPRELLFDQMRSVLTRDDRLVGGGLVSNLEFLRFCRHYDVKARVCRPYRAKTKGKVERPIRYLRESFLYGRTFLSDADLNAQVLHWLETVANARVHGTTKVIPAVRFATEERALLQPLPARAYRSLVLGERLDQTTAQRDRTLSPRALRPGPHVDVERRSLEMYAMLASAGGYAVGEDS